MTCTVVAFHAHPDEALPTAGTMARVAPAEPEPADVLLGYGPHGGPVRAAVLEGDP